LHIISSNQTIKTGLDQNVNKDYYSKLEWI